MGNGGVGGRRRIQTRALSGSCRETCAQGGSQISYIHLPMVALLLALTVVIDPGHGGSNTGAPGVRGTYEKQVTLGIARALKRRLERESVHVVMTRTRD